MNQLMLDHLWQSTLFAILAGPVILAPRNHRANIRFCVWFSASLKFLMPFPLVAASGKSMRWDTARTLPSLSEWSDASFVAPANVLPAASDIRPIVSSHMHLGPILWWIWVCGAAWLLARWTFQWRQLRAASRGASPASIEAPVPMANSPVGPGLVGIFRPVLLLPAGWTSGIEKWPLGAGDLTTPALGHPRIQFMQINNAKCDFVQKRTTAKEKKDWRTTAYFWRR